MKKNISLKSIFAIRKDDLSQKLNGLTLPKDAQRVEMVVTDFLNNLFETEGDYRQHLTQSEDYVLQAAISILSAQQTIISELTKVASKPRAKSTTVNRDDEIKVGLRKKQIPITIGGSAIGSAAGAIALGTWGAVFGAIAGTAIVIYYTAQQNQTKTGTKEITEKHTIAKENIINTETFIDIVENVCQSVDTLIDTFRAQVTKVVEKYENKDKPALEKEYFDLVENIQSLLGAYEMDSSNNNRMKRIEQRIQLLAEGLENYNIQVTNYDGNNKELFNFQPSTNVEKDSMVLPAVVKEDKIIIKGKVFTKE